MNTVAYIAGWLFIVSFLIGVGASISMFVHERRSLTDHGPDCWWCHPRIPGRHR